MQLAATIAVIALAAGFLLRAAWRAFFRKSPGCGSGCGKCATTDPPEQKGRYSLPQV
ncbi:MAG: FeoB-associated Cys-rich membrane protein [Gemmataceae bacterium]